MTRGTSGGGRFRHARVSVCKSPVNACQQEASTSVPIAFDHHGMVLEFLQWFEHEGRRRGVYAEEEAQPTTDTHTPVMQ